MRRSLTWVVVALASAVVLAVATAAVLPFLVDTPRIQGLIASSASQALGRPVRFASLSISVLPLPAVVLRNLEIAEDPAFGSTPFLRLNEARVRLRLWPLLQFRVELGDFILREPVISLIQLADGRWNFASLGPSQEPRAAGRPRASSGGAGAAAAVGSRVKLENGVVNYEARGGQRGSHYRVERLDLTLTGGPGPVTFKGDALVKPGDLVIKISDGAVGVNAGRTVGEAPLRGRLSLDGRQIRELAAGAIGPQPSLGGHLKGTLTLRGTVGRPRAAGDVELSDFSLTQVNAQCPEPKRRTLALGLLKASVAWEEPRFTARPLSTTLGGSVTTNVTATLEQGVRLELGDITVKTVPAEKILVDFLCQGYAVTGPVDLRGHVSARLGEPWTTLDGAGQVRVGPGRVVGSQALALLGGLIRVGAVSALLGGEAPGGGLAPTGLEYESITGRYTISSGVVSTRDLLFTSRALTLSAAGSYALASGAMNLELLVTVARRDIKAKVTGSAASPSVMVAPESVLRGKEQEKLERSLQDLLKRFR